MSHLPQVLYCAKQTESCSCNGIAYFGSLDSLFNQDSSESYLEKEVKGSIECSSSAFGDISNGTAYCFCDGGIPPLPNLPLSTKGSQIVDEDDTPVTLACANWYGAHMTRYVVNGLDTVPMDFISRSIAGLGFNCVRLVFSLE